MSVIACEKFLLLDSLKIMGTTKFLTVKDAFLTPTPAQIWRNGLSTIFFFLSFSWLSTEDERNKGEVIHNLQTLQKSGRVSV